MARYKKSIIALAIAFFICMASALYLILPKKAYAVGSDISISEDFTAIRMSGSVANSYSNLVSDANTLHGAIPGSSWGQHVSGGNAELIYKISSEDGYVLNTSSLTFTVGSGHASGIYWYNASRQGASSDVLGNNLIVYVSSDNETWTSVYNLDEAEHPTRNAQDYYSNKYSPVLDLTQYAKNSSTFYVKFDIQHFTTEECCVDGWTSGIPLNQIGLGMYSVNLTATQGEVSDVTVSSDFTKAGPSATANGLYEYNNVITDVNGHLAYGLIPAEAWGGYVKILPDAYVTYKLKAVEGYAFSSLNVDLDVAFGHKGIAAQAEKTDVAVAISYDNVSFTDIYSLRADETAIAVGESTAKGAGIHEVDKRYELSLNLGDNLEGTGELYVRVKLVGPNHSEITETAINVDGDGNKIIPLGKVGARLYSAEITAGQSKIDDSSVVNDWRTAGIVSSFVGVVDHDSVVKYVNGNETFGLIPASNWADPVNSISTGYVTYKISATDTYVFNSMLLKMSIRYGAVSDAYKNGAADFIIYTGYDGTNFSKTYSLYEDKGIGNSVTNMDVTVDLSSVAKNYGVLFVKIEMKCPTTESVNLGKIPTCLLGVDLTATQASVVKNAFTISEVYGNDKGTNLSANYSTIVDSSNVFDGNKTFALIPSAGWGASVDALNGYVTYKVTTPADKSFNNLRLQLAYKLKEGANVIVSTSYDGEIFTEFYNAVLRLGDKAYSNNLTWTLGQENNSYQMLDIDLKSVAENAGTIYVKVDLQHPTENVTLQGLKTEIFSVRFSGNYSDYSPYVGRIICNLDGGSYADQANPETFTAEDGIITLVNPVKQYMEFMGWYDNPEFSGEAVTSIDASIITTHRLYAKWQDAIYDFDVRIAGTGSGTLKIDDQATSTSVIKVNAKSTIKFELDADSDSIIYSLNIDGEDKFLTDGTNFTLRNIDKGAIVIATFNARETLNGDFHIDYTDNVKYGNKWKNGLYDFANLYITDDERHALGINNGQGYITYKFEAPDGKYFESATLTTYAKLFDNYLMGTNEKVDYYVSYDNEDYTLVYKSLLNRKGENYVTVVQNLTEYVIGKQSFFLKVEIGSNSTNWTLVNWLDMAFTYETVELSINYGGYYTDVTYDQVKGLPFDSSILKVKEGYELSDNNVYTDSSYQQILATDTLILNDMKLYVKCGKTTNFGGNIEYVLNGGENHAENPDEYVYGDVVVFKAPTKEGYAFVKWTIDGDDVTGITEGMTGDITVTAVWSIVNYNINYVLDGGENSNLNPDNYNIQTNAITLAEPVKDGYTFAGWYTEAGFVNLITEIAQGRTGDITVYAKWISNQVPDVDFLGEITYVLNGGVNHADNPNEYVYGDVVVFKAPTKEGFTFGGWFKDEACTISIVSINATDTADFTIYAKWNAVIVDDDNDNQGGANDGQMPDGGDQTPDGGDQTPDSGEQTPPSDDTPTTENKGCSGSVDACAVIGIAVILAGAMLIVIKKLRKN